MIHIDGTKTGNLQYEWAPSTNEICVVPEGELFKIDIPDASTMQIKRDFTVKDLESVDRSIYDAAVGPIKVEGAEKGDALEIEIVDISVGSWGWTNINPGFGLIKNRFDRELVKWDLTGDFAKTTGDFLKNVLIPKRPFLGVIATLPSRGRYGVIAPRNFGGNMDNRLLSAGTRLLLPVNLPGAMVCFGDPHASQGDGEVCGTAIETSAQLLAKLRVIKNRNLRVPKAVVPPVNEGESVVASGISGSLKTAARTAVLEMIQELTFLTDLSEAEAYMLCSVIGNLKISEIVDEPNYVVSMSVPTSVLKKRMK